MSQYVLGIDLGGTFIKAGVVDESANVVSRTRCPTGAERGADAVVDAMAEAAEDAVARSGAGWEAVSAAGLGAPGLIDCCLGVPLASPNLRLLEGVPLARKLAEKLGRDVPVVLENDANAAAYGEFWAGAGRDADSLVLMTLGTGIGGGVVLDGRIWHGAHGFAGELGHAAIFADGDRCACGARGCLEAYASASAMERRFAETLRAGRASALADAVRQGEKVSAKDIHQAAAEGDAAACEAIEETGRFLGIAAANFVHVFDPDLIVFAGGLTGAGDMLLEAARIEAEARMFAALADKVKIVFAQLGAEAGLIGAAGWAMRKAEGRKQKAE